MCHLGCLWSFRGRAQCTGDGDRGRHLRHPDSGSAAHVNAGATDGNPASTYVYTAPNSHRNTGPTHSNGNLAAYRHTHGDSSYLHAHLDASRMSNNQPGIRGY